MYVFDKSRIIKLDNHFFSIKIDTDNFKFIHSGCWNTECKNKIIYEKLEKYPFINTALYNQLHVTNKINSERDISFLSLIGDNIYQKYYDPVDKAPTSLLYKISNGLECIEPKILLGLGNHDVDSKITYDFVMGLDQSPKYFIPNNFYCIIFENKDYTFKMVYINTNILADHENTEDYYKTLSKDDYELLQKEQYEFIETALNSEKYETKYTFVLGHDPIIVAHHANKDYSVPYQETKKEELLKINKLINNKKVDFYLSADEHNLQSISSKKSSLKYIISGGGGALSDFPKALYNEKIKDPNFILENENYKFNNVIASHGYVKFEITNKEIKYHFVVPDYVTNNLNAELYKFDNSIFDQPFKIIKSDISTNLYISPKCETSVKIKGGSLYKEKYLKYKNKYIQLKNI